MRLEQIEEKHCASMATVYGRPFKTHALLVIEHISAVACTSVAALLNVKTVRGASDEETFYIFTG